MEAPMSEVRQMRWIALGMFVGALLFAAMFITSGFSLLWMLLTAAFVVGAFMALLLSFAA